MKTLSQSLSHTHTLLSRVCVCVIAREREDRANDSKKIKGEKEEQIEHQRQEGTEVNWRLTGLNPWEVMQA